MQYFYSFNKLKEKEKNCPVGVHDCWKHRFLEATSGPQWNIEVKSKGWKRVVSKLYESVLYITVMGKRVEFGASWVEDVDRVYMHLNLSTLGGGRDES
ncbi:hypothetical protein DVH24_019874 [Malus domestica]|uniref:Uncharacterized protein n=1 Tax=Malus domestica TaxID=3750 RepID=A0A498I048_MALDO|nr:hypothetical protein DVH24_019874 [Malus domestica]